jgi:hypothetical protein
MLLSTGNSVDGSLPVSSDTFVPTEIETMGQEPDGDETTLVLHTWEDQFTGKYGQPLLATRNGGALFTQVKQGFSCAGIGCGFRQ